MAKYNGNGVYVTLDGVNVSAYYTEVSLQGDVEAIEVTAGAGTTHKQFNAGLNSTAFDLTLYYEDTSATLATYLPKLKAGSKYTVVFGPEGAVTGKPKHEQMMLVQSVDGPMVGVAKPFVVFSLSLIGADAPVSDLTTGVF